MIQYPFYFRSLYTKVEPLESYVKYKTGKILTGLEQVHVASPINDNLITFEPSYLNNVKTMKDLLNRAVQLLLLHKKNQHLLVTTYESLNKTKNNKIVAEHKEPFLFQTFQTDSWLHCLNLIGIDNMFDILLNATIFIQNGNNSFYLLSGVPIPESNASILRPLKVTSTLKKFKNTYLYDLSTPDSNISGYISATLTNSKKRKKKNKCKHADGRQKKMKQSQHNNENMQQQISQNFTQKSIKRGQESDAQLSIISSKKFKRIHSVKNRDLCSSSNQLLSGKYCLDHNQIFYAHPTIDTKTQQPSFIFDTLIIFGSNSIRNHEYRHEINHHILQLIFPNEFKRKVSHLPKRMEKIEFIADYLRMNHPLSMLTPLLNSICLQKVNKFNTEDLAIPHGQVFLFIKTLLKQVLPSYIFGSTHNWQVFFKNVNKYIDLRKKETLRIYDIFWGLRLNDCTWLATLSPSKHVVPSELEKKKDLLIQLLRWLFDLYIPKILRTCFYITEHAQYRNRVFYYRHDTWLQLISHYINKSLYEDYEKIDINTINNQHLGSASLRFIPKRNDLRTITNMKLAFKVKNQEDIYKKSQPMNNNNVLKEIKSILQLEIDRQKNLTGSAVNSIYSALEKIANYKKDLNLQEESSNTKIYFSKIDIMHCFNNINQNILLDVLKQIFMEDQYIIQKSTTLKPGRNKSFRVVKLLAKIHDDTKSIPTTLNNFNDFPRKSIINDDMAQMIESTKNILDLLVEHIKQNTVLYNDELYKQKVGISQGSCLSTLLCNLYYGHVEKQELSFLKQDQNGLLLRYVDDFLYVSTNRDFVERFDITMSRGLPKYGCYINHQKKVNNLNNSISEFPWCGFLLSTKNLDVFNDYSDYTLQGIKDSITLETSNYKNAIINKSIRDINTEFQLIKVSANTHNAMLRNIYEGSLLIGFKLSIYCLQLSYTVKEEINQKFLLNIIFYLTQYILSLVPKNLPRNKAIWLILYAFYTSHKRHQQQFDAIIKCLARCLNQYGPNKRSKKSIKQWPASFIFFNKKYKKNDHV